jgi:hypothetical protein
MFSRQFHCIDCGGTTGYRSRSRNFLEKYVLPILLLRPVRCSDCFRRCYCFVWVDVRERNESHVPHRYAA